jgi:hypothetical protein
MQMLAISLWQPWASAIFAGVKRIETRSWATAHRGRLAIAATLSTPPPDLRGIEPALRSYAAKFAEIGIMAASDMPHGAVIGTVDLIDCRVITHELIDRTKLSEIEWGIWVPGRFAWYFDNIVAFKTPVPCRGGQRLWDWKEAA